MQYKIVYVGSPSQCRSACKATVVMSKSAMKMLSPLLLVVLLLCGCLSTHAARTTDTEDNSAGDKSS